ncbi:phage tail tape measure protein, partial [Dissulfurispira sp.]|uniref:phage tail tape measure protein n=1 Tax=Dissulfurispira sp. TaxID=2817609 RepID=UPI002FD983FD
NAMLLKLKTADRQGKEFQAGLNAIGYSAEQLKADIEKDAEGALIKFLERLRGVKKEELAGVLSDLFGMQYSDDVALLVSGLDQYKKALKETADESKFAGAMQKEFENRAKTTANQLQLLKNNLAASAINIGTVFLPAVNSIVGAVTPVLGVLGKVAEKFPTATKVAGGLAIGFIGLKIASMGVRWGFSWIADGAGMAYRAMMLLRPSVLMTTIEMHKQKAAAIGSAIAIRAKTAALWIAGAASKAYAIGSTLVVGATRAIATAFRLMGAAIISNPIGLAITALAIGAALIIANWGKVKAFFIGIWQSIQSFLQGFNLFSVGQKIIGSLWEGITSMASKPIEAVSGIAKKIRNLLPFSPAKEGPFKDLHKVNIVGTIAETMKPTPMVSAMENAMLGVRAVLQPITQPVRQMFEPARQMMPAMAGGYGASAMPLIQITQNLTFNGNVDRTTAKQVAAQTASATEDAVRRVIERYFANKARKEW